MMRSLFILFITIFLWSGAYGDFQKHSIPLDAIQSGGPPKDGIPALTDPMVIPAPEAKYLENDDEVLGLSINGNARAYPIRLLNWHEIVNDTLGEKHVLVTYCPLCGTGIGFDPILEGKRYTFGVSGKLYNSDLLMYDRQTDSLWAQILGEAVVGKLTGTRLRLLPLAHTTWSDWKKRHPKTTVLSKDTGHFREYERDPYEGYANQEKIYFPVTHLDDRFPAKAVVYGLRVGKAVRAYPLDTLMKMKKITDTLGGKQIEIRTDSLTGLVESFEIKKGGNRIPYPGFKVFWFAWAAFYPETTIYKK